MKIVAAIPCLNTQPSIGSLVSKAKNYVDEVIVIDDGSSDGTVEIARSAGALVISHRHNMGKGAAMKTAAQNTDADVIVFLDGDGQHAPEDIPNLVAPIFQSQADLVIGSRCLPRSKAPIAPIGRRLSNALASLVISAMISVLLPLSTCLGRLVHFGRSGAKADATSRRANRRPSTGDYRLLTGKLKWISDCTSGFRAVRREAWQKLDLTSQGYQIETEMIYEAASHNLSIAEVPVSCNWNSQFSGLSVSRDGLRTIRLLLRKLLTELREERGSGP